LFRCHCGADAAAIQQEVQMDCFVADAPRNDNSGTGIGLE
jgi:hypothetical protein